MWNPSEPIGKLPEKVRGVFRNVANNLILGLERNKLVIGLAPGSDSRHPYRKRRVVVHSNPSWYSELYHSYPHFRRDRSVNALSRIRDLEDKTYLSGTYKYDFIYRRLILENLIINWVGFTEENEELIDFLREYDVGQFDYDY